jgi:hypothetical protein
VARTVEDDIGRLILGRIVDYVETEGGGSLRPLRRRLTEGDRRSTSQASTRGHEQTDRPRPDNMGPVTDTQTAPANAAYRHGDRLDQRGATEVERRGQGDQVIGGDGHEVGGTAIDVDPDEAEPLANLGAVAAASPTSAARKQRVDEHRCASLEIRGRTCQAADYLMAEHQARAGTGVLALGDVEVSAADAHVSWLDQYPARRM